MRSVLLGTAVIWLAVAVPGAEARPFDFDGDGRQDAVLGMPGWSPGGAPNAGAVAVLTPGGHGAISAHTLFEGDGMPGTAEGDEAFGSALTSGDFNADGFADLAVAAPGERSVFVVPGHRDGLRPEQTTVLPITGALLLAEDAISGELLTADLDGDRYADLLVGAVDADYARKLDYGSGRIDVYSGGPRGIAMSPATRLRRPRRGDERFGAVLAVGDVDGDRRPDVVEGSQGDPYDIDDDGVPGHLSYCSGGRSGPTRCRALGRPIKGGPTALSIADVDGDGYGDIIAGHPVNRFVADPGYDDPPGAVRIWRGSKSGPQGPPLSMTQNTAGIPGRSTNGDEFGADIATLDLDGDAYADLVIGAPGENDQRGRVTLVRGGRDGLARSGAFTLQEGRAGIPGARRDEDRFGHVLAVLRFDADRRPDLVVGMPGDRAASIVTGLRARGFNGAAKVTPASLGLVEPPDPPDVLQGFGELLGAP